MNATSPTGDEPRGSAALTRVASSGSSEVVEHALDVLLCFADARSDLGVTEIARRLGMDKGRVHRFLSAFRRKGFVTVNTRTHRYSLGFRALELSHALTWQFNVAAQVQPFLEELRDATSETSGFVALVGSHRVNLAQAESEQEIRQQFPLGRPLPVYAGSAGKVLLAFLPPEEVDRLLPERLEPLAESTITSREQLRSALDQIRRQGYAVSCGERSTGAQSIAAPAWSWRGDVMAVNVSGPSFRFTQEKALATAPLLKDVAVRLTRHLGGEPFAAALRDAELGDMG